MILMVGSYCGFRKKLEIVQFKEHVVPLRTLDFIFFFS